MIKLAFCPFLGSRNDKKIHRVVVTNITEEGIIAYYDKTKHTISMEGLVGYELCNNNKC